MLVMVVVLVMLVAMVIISRGTAAVLHFFGTKQIICCHQMAVPLT